MISTTDVDQAQATIESLDRTLDQLDELIRYAWRRGWRDRITTLRTLRAQLQAQRNQLEALFT